MRAFIYDSAILPLTTRWYSSVLERIGQGEHLLDVGIGTAGALARNRVAVRARRIKVTGVDIDEDYVKKARSRIRKAGLDGCVEVQLESVYNHRGGPYDAVYFSSSFMLLPDPKGALDHVAELLKPGGRIFFTQTFQERRSALVERTKPLLQKVTTIDFGTVTYEDDFRQVVFSAGMELLEFSTLNRVSSMSGRLAVARLRAS
ncbi:MAG: class I SAM-dependent methyltransferase [Deltaproteobacteria bacterium]|nr:class I SAM-dependent methyltransferase [Deltaproteobacteria bacterium]